MSKSFNEIDYKVESLYKEILNYYKNVDTIKILIT